MLMRPGRFHRELDQEMTFHREQAEQELRAEGMSAEEARHVARRRFGNDLRLKEQNHEIVGFRLESILLDLRLCSAAVAKESRVCVYCRRGAGAGNSGQRGDFCAVRCIV